MLLRHGASVIYKGQAEDYDTEIKAYAQRLKNSTCADGKKIVLPGEDRVANKNKITDGLK